MQVGYWHVLIPAPVWGLIACIIILGLAHGSDVLERLGFFGTISYSLYVFRCLVLLAWLSYRLIEARASA